MDFLHFKKSLKKAKLLPVYVIYGEEELFVHEAVSLIRSRVLGKEESDISLIEIDDADVPFSTIAEELQTVPFFGSDKKRLVVVYGADRLVASSRDQLKGYMESPSPFSCLVLICNDLDRRTSFFNKLNRMGGTISCKKVQNEQLPAWIMGKAKSYGKQMTLDACNVLVENVGDNLSLLASHIEKLAISAGKRLEIRPCLLYTSDAADEN